MKESPIILTPEQKTEFLKKKQKEFMNYVQKAEAVTGMGIRPVVEYTPFGVIPKIVIVPLEKKDDTKSPPKSSDN